MLSWSYEYVLAAAAEKVRFDEASHFTASFGDFTLGAGADVLQPNILNCDSTSS